MRKDGGKMDEPSHVPQKIALSAAVQTEGQDIVGGTLIRTIFSGPTCGGDSNRARKAHIREGENTPGIFLIDLANKPKKEAKIRYNTSHLQMKK